MAKRRLSDRTLKSLKPSSTKRRYEVMDDLVPGFGVRVNDRGLKTFVLIARYPGSRNPTRRSLGVYDTLSLEDARKKARAWHQMLSDGIDPRIERDRKQREDARRQGNPFGKVAADYFEHIKRQGQRSAEEVDRCIRREFVSLWRDRPVAEVGRADVVGAINGIVKRGAATSAHNALAYLRSLFNWAVECGAYNLDASPCASIKPKRLIGKKEVRNRILSDDELRAFWRVTGRMPFPWGPLFRMLLLTGQRRAEVAEAHWNEFDFENKVWTVPSERFKSDSTHLVPLTDDVIALLRNFCRIDGSTFLFTTTGRTAVSGFSKAKKHLDLKMLLTLRASARRRGEDPHKIVLTPFVLHDLRRTMRTRLSSLRIADTIAEAVIGHGKKGLQRVYDQHQYATEMREALEAWTGRLRDIVTPSPQNVVPLRAQGGRDGT